MGDWKEKRISALEQSKWKGPTAQEYLRNGWFSLLGLGNPKEVEWYEDAKNFDLVIKYK